MPLPLPHWLTQIKEDDRRETAHRMFMWSVSTLYTFPYRRNHERITKDSERKLVMATQKILESDEVNEFFLPEYLRVKKGMFKGELPTGGRDRTKFVYALCALYYSPGMKVEPMSIGLGFAHRTLSVFMNNAPCVSLRFCRRWKKQFPDSPFTLRFMNPDLYADLSEI